MRRQRRRRKWTDSEGVPSFVEILTSDTPPPSEDEDEVEDRVWRERWWRKERRLVVDVDAFLGLAPPKDEGEEKDENEVKGENENEGRGTSGEGKRPGRKRKRVARSSLYRIGSDVRARLWDAAARGGGRLGPPLCCRQFQT